VDRRALTHRIEYLLVRGVEAAVTTLPERLSDRLGAGIGGLVHAPLGIRRATVVANLRRAFPDAPETWIRRTARGAYRHLGRETAAMLRLGELAPDEVIRRTEMVGWDAFEAAVGEGRGVVLSSGHFGNWEVAAAAVAVRGIPMSAIVQRQSNPLVFERIEASRHRFGLQTIERGEAPRQVPRALRAGRVVGVVLDQDARESGVWVPFFGHPSSTPRGAALFALRFNTPVFTIAAIRLPGKLRYRVVLDQVIPRRRGDLETDIVQLTADLTARLEAVIRDAPEQYFWFHKRWKTPPPAELPLVRAGTTASERVVAQPGDDLA
jgi:Kdo2-lipid IVA lauroyltransferase/acyltransferase